MSCYSLPGIAAIHTVRCSDLEADLMLRAICGCTPVVTAPAELVEFTGVALLKWEGSMVNGARQEKSTLEFSTIHHLPEGVHLAFIVTSVNGPRYLIGTKEGCYPIIEYSDTTGEQGRTPAVRTYKVTHIAQVSVLPCTVRLPVKN